VFLIDAVVSGERPFRIRIFEQEYTVWAFDVNLRREVYSRFPLDKKIKVYAELGLHNGEWQFVVRDTSWLKP
jgi:hypothetical protein